MTPAESGDYSFAKHNKRVRSSRGMACVCASQRSPLHLRLSGVCS